ncbi:MAG: class I SAM-dependent methyltransferase [Blastocatellia bacterium]
MPAVETPLTASPHELINAHLSPVEALHGEFERQAALDFEGRMGLDYQATIAELLALAELRPDMNVLDVGAGTSILVRHLDRLLGEKGQVTAMDTTPEMVEKARLATITAGPVRHVRWQVAPAETLPFQAGEFDVVTCAMAFPRLRAAEFAREAFRVLKPGGRLVMATELAPRQGLSGFQKTMRRGFYQFLRRDALEAAASFMTADETAGVLTAAGFRQNMFRQMQRNGRHQTIFSLVRALK